MALGPGARLGIYEIAAQIGAGGMGAVYLATDTILGRQVAIKVLPDAFSHDAERLARLEREARTLASLNHPNIAAIYGFEKSPTTHALVMELVEGEDLSRLIERHRAKREGLPIDEALSIAKQIVDALEVAHEHNIIHRDLKPANIKVRPDGAVKVLDFGIAKAVEGAGTGGAGGENPSQSPTITTPAMTLAGVILGTAAYMSPEQARGKTVDRRADIWAFGVVLYEMLTGRHAFDGADMTEVLGAVVRLEPDFGALTREVPPRVRRVLQLCLRKDPSQRLQAMGDVRLALEGAFETVSSATVERPFARSASLAWMAFAAAAFATAALAVPTVRHLREAPPSPPEETRLDIVTPSTVDPTSFALSPDGRQIVLSTANDGERRLWLRSLATTTGQLLAGTEGAFNPFWSPDSRSVGFYADGKLKRIDIGGGAPQTVAATSSRGGTWNADGIILFTTGGTSPLFRVPASGGPPVAVTKLDRETSHRFPFFLPDGRHFLFYAVGTPDTNGVYLGSLDSRETHRLTAADAAGVYLSSSQTLLAERSRSRPAGATDEGGWLLSVRNGTLVAQRLDLERQALTGNPVTLVDTVATDALLNAVAVSVSAGGLVAYRTGGATRRQLAWFNRSGKALGFLGGPDESSLLYPSVSPDGRRAVVSRTVQGNQDLWLMDGSRPTRFSFDPALDRFPVWSPDGTRIVFDSTRNGPRDLYLGSSNRAGAEEPIVASAQDKAANDWSADGRFVVYHSLDPQTSRDLWVLPMSGDRKPWVFLKTPFNERLGAFSPDGRWVAYLSNESGRNEIYIRPFPGPASPDAALRPHSVQTANVAGGQWQVSTAGGIFPRWRSDGKELYYLGPSGAMMAAPITVTGSGVMIGAPAELFPTRVLGGGVDIGLGRQYDVTRDGRFLINMMVEEPSSTITLLMNWNPEAKR